MKTIANSHEYTIEKRNEDREYPFEICIDGQRTGYYCRTFERAQQRIAEEKKEYQRDNSIEKDFAVELSNDLDIAMPRYSFWGNIHTPDDGYKEEGCEIQIHYPDIDPDGHDWGNSIWVTDCHSIALRYLTNFGLSLEETKIFARIVSLYVGETSLTYRRKELYKFVKGEEI